MNSLISQRAKNIIEILCNNKNSITTKEISEKLEVSKRTVLREMDSVEKWLKKNQIEVERKPRIGIILNANDEEKKHLKSLLKEESIEKIFSPKERQDVILSELLKSSDPVKIYYFTNVFNVSEATISNDLDKVEEDVEKYNLKLIRKSGFGIYIEGNENHKRKLMINLLYEYLDKNQASDLIKENISSFKEENNINMSVEVRNRLLNLIDRKTISEVEKIFDLYQKDIENKLTDSAYIGLLIHLSLAIKRIKDGEEISMDVNLLDELKTSEEYDIADKLIKNIEKIFQIHIPEDEIGYVTMHLKGSKIRDITQRKEDLSIGNFELIKIANKIIKYAERETGYLLKNDENLLEGLVSHLQPAITRLKMNMNIRNPLLDEIKDKYAEYFNLSEKSLVPLKDKLGIEIPESEIGFITMHLGSAIEKAKKRNSVLYRVIITCTSGIGTSKMLSSRIDEEFKNIKVVDIKSTIDIDKKWLEQETIDFIISTVNLEGNDLPVITVTPLLVKKDIMEIKNFIKKIEMRKRNTFNKEERKNVGIKNKKILSKDIKLKEKVSSLIIYSQTMLNIVNNYFFQEKEEVKDFEELIHKLSFLSTENKDKREIIIKDILMREELGSTVIQDNNIILIHSRTDAVDTIKLGIFRLGKPIYKIDNKINLAVLMLAPKVIDERKLDVIREISRSLVTDEVFIKILINGNEEEIYSKIESILYGFLIEKI